MRQRKVRIVFDADCDILTQFVLNKFLALNVNYEL